MFSNHDGELKMKKIFYTICLVSILLLAGCNCVEVDESGCTEDSDCCSAGFLSDVDCEYGTTETWINCRGCAGTREACAGTDKEWCRVSGGDGVCREINWSY